MRFPLIPLFALLAATLVPTGCHLAPKDNPGDTVAATVFNPPDTAALNRKAREQAKAMPMRDSANVFYIGTGSTRRELQLVSFPSRHDTIVRGKSRHLRVEGRGDTGRVVRVELWVSPHGDTLVSHLQEVLPEELQAEATARKALRRH